MHFEILTLVWLCGCTKILIPSWRSHITVSMTSILAPVTSSGDITVQRLKASETWHPLKWRLMLGP